MPRPRPLVGPLVAAIVIAACLSPRPAAAEADTGYVFPADAGLVDVTRAPYDADPTGRRDSTAAIQKALDDHASLNAIIYLPDGTYRVTDTLRWGEGSSEGGFMKRTILQGQSAEGAVLRVPDGTPAFGDPASPRAVVFTGRPPAQRFRNSIRSLTVHTGTGNPGAIGIQYIANNQGAMHDVTIRSGDGGGVVGLDLAIAEQGPALIRNVRVHGFDVGIRNGHIVNSITLEHVRVEDQNRFGLTNENQVVSVRGLTSRNRVPAVRNRGGGGMMTLVDADLSGPGEADRVPGPAIVNEGGAFLLARDVRSPGYQEAVRNDSGHGESVASDALVEFVSHPVHTLFDHTPTATLRLPVRETPEVPWDGLSAWAGPQQFGGQTSKDFDNTRALQAAIDSGASTIYLPRGVWRIDGEVVVRGSVRRFIGCEAKLAGAGTVRIAEGASEVVRFERIDMIYEKVKLVHDSPRALVVSSVTFGENDTLLSTDRAGDLFLEDVCVGTLRVRPGQNVWARQLNPEAKVTKITNEGGNLWVLGLKTEQNGTAVHALAGGRTEVLGFFCYANSGDRKVPLFVMEEGGRLSVNLTEMVIRNEPFRTLVVETRGGETRQLSIGDTPGRGGGSAVPLFVAGPATDH